MIDFIDSKVSENTFTRVIKDQRFTFENNKLITTEILGVQDWIKIFSSYEDTDHVSLNPFNKLNSLSGHHNLIRYLKNTKIYRNYFRELFIFMIFLLFIFSYLTFSLITYKILLTSFIPGIRFYSNKGNIVKLRRVRSIHKWEDVIFK